MSAAALFAADAGVPEALRTSHGGEVLDTQALVAYRRRLAGIDNEIDEARGLADLVREESLETEREALLGEVRAATGLGGRRAGWGTAKRGHYRGPKVDRGVNRPHRSP